MKNSLIPFVAICGGIAVAIVYLNHTKSSTSAPVATPSTVQANDMPASAPVVTAPKQQAIIPETPAKPADITTTPPVASTATTTRAQSEISKAVDGLLAAKSAAEKHDLFQQLVKSGQLDQAIAELKQRALDNPNDAGIPTTLGEAILNKVKTLYDTGADKDEMGILAMQADQSFNAALKIDPQNWEAQFVKASSMYYWPADPTRDNDVVQRLSNLIDQQETMSAQPEFSKTYVLLGEEYQKIGQPDKAMATWQLGAQKFPGDPALQKKISGQ